jgi:hypothetical protein
VQRVNELQVEVDRLYARYRELEEQKRPLLDTLAALAQTPTTEADAGTGLAAIPLPTPCLPSRSPSPGFSGNFPGFTVPTRGSTPQPVEPPRPRSAAADRGSMELRHLRYFDAVAETLNFTRAAETPARHAVHAVAPDQAAGGSWARRCSTAAASRCA